MPKLNRKNIAQGSGAESLANLMATLTTGMDLYPLPISSLKDAPDDWNFYKPLSETQFFELVDSIARNGLISPLLVWDQGDGTYMILSGHNRKRALSRLFESTQNQNYSTAHCLVKPKDSISEEEARILLIDANWCQRQLSPSERARSIYEKYVSLGRSRSGEGRIYERLAETYCLKATQVYQYLQLRTLEDTWKERLDNGTLSIKAGVWLSKMKKESRTALSEIQGNEITSQEILKLPKDCEPDFIEARKNAPRSRVLKITVPEQLYYEAQSMMTEWLKGHSK